jgi:hypothetical protein
MSKRRRSLPQHGNLLKIVIPLDDSPWRTSFDLTENELYAIGLATVHWSYLEWALLVRTKALARRWRDVPSQAFSRSFSRRLKALRTLAEERIRDPRRKEALFKLLSRISKCEGHRHRYIHGIWTYNARKPNSLWVVLNHEERFEHTTFEKIIKFCEEVGELSFALAHPRSRKDALPNKSYASRSLLLELEGKQ